MVSPPATVLSRWLGAGGVVALLAAGEAPSLEYADFASPYPLGKLWREVCSETQCWSIGREAVSVHRSLVKCCRS
ncbi:hypothetical protein NDU88_001151 [Pleurodeles waltl]|uniref:Secreted protein n=1 Tax=Pleurodeles waltl TaxID=8319 RepID=A0AAV7S6M0_PLEWA|nr:hypothetical protein NDU88_001151 [Pleurodeles waltl]